MKFKRYLRILICLVLVCAFLINISPVKARADAVSGTLAITSAAGVTISAPMVVAAALVVLGVGYVTNSDFQQLVNDCVIGLGDIVVDGSIELLHTVDALGKSIFYIGGDIFESIRGWLFDSETVVMAPSGAMTFSWYVGSVPWSLEWDCRAVPFLVQLSDGRLASYFCFGGTYANGTKYRYSSVWKENLRPTYDVKAGAYFYYDTIYAPADAPSFPIFGSDLTLAFQRAASQYEALVATTQFDLTLGLVPTVPIDGTSAREWALTYANRGLYVVPGSGTGGNEGQDGKWFWPLFFGLSASILAAMSQAESWVADTPPEFSEYEEKEEYDDNSGTGV